MLSVCALRWRQEYVDVTTADVKPRSLAEEVATEPKVQADDMRGLPPHSTDKGGVHDQPEAMIQGAGGGAH